MLLTSVILILQETLEAALLISILAVVSVQGGRRPGWLPAGLLAGGVLAFAYAFRLEQVSAWFDYAGQELVNAFLQTGITLVLLPLCWMVAREHATAGSRATASRWALQFQILCAVVIGLAVTREGSEIIVYLAGNLAQHDKAQAVLVGGAIGFGIGVSIGCLLFFGAMAFRGRRRHWLPLGLLALFAGNMLAQASMQLVQADWLSAGPPLWDSSGWLPEHSAAGRLLYALVGYESKPALCQLAAYLLGAGSALICALLGSRQR